MQESTLPQRLARSAKNLASATLTGANFEVKDPRENKQAGSSSTQTSLGNKEHCSGNVGSKSNANYRETEFRSRPNSIIRRQTEEDFDQFQQIDDFQIWHTPGSAASSESMHDEDMIRERSTTSNNESQTTSAAEYSAFVKDHTSDMLVLNKPLSTSATETRSSRGVNVSYSHAAAIQRLNQIGGHLQRSVVMQALEPDAFTRSHLLTHDIMSGVQVEHAQQIVDELRDLSHSEQSQQDRCINDQQISSSHHDPVERETISSLQARKGKEKEQEAPQRRFHCPYYACHQNMRMFSTSTPSSSQRSCVHVGCDYHSETFTSWTEHVHTPHHDLQG